MTNYEVAFLFAELADLLEIEGENSFKVLAYRKAARAIENLPEPLAELVAADRLRRIPGIGEAIAAKISQLLTEGRIDLLERARAEVPAGVREMLALPGVGPRHAHTFWKDLGLTSITALRAAAVAKRLRTAKGLGAKLEQAILTAIDVRANPDRRVLLGVARSLARQIAGDLARLTPAAQVEFAGSARRGKETVGDLDLVVAADQSAEVMTVFTKLPYFAEIVAAGETKATARHVSGIQVDLRVVAPAEFAAALLHSTGSKEHNVRLRGLAKEQGWRLNEYGLEGFPEPLPDEASIYRALGLDFIPPELREDRGEIEAAAAGRLPVLLARTQIRGDLHCHSEWSDGVATLRGIRESTASLGYEYVAICDHTKSLGVAHGLNLARLVAQGEEIAALNREGHPVRLLRGAEVDILADGTLDHPDEVLASLDIVVASIHSGFRQGPAQLLSRVERALRNPHVDILAHPSGRLLGRREPYALDLDAVVRLALETGTVLEINASPDRLDLPDVPARALVAAGGVLSIDTDAHAPEQFDNMEYGVTAARRAWCGPQSVLNALPLAQLMAFLATPKPQRLSGMPQSPFSHN